ncbi:MAG: hypothetical protein J2P33_22220, partial [Actinobacteria bacterium]|nr:hypothetical protein [Actinomycetota bacterium]
PGGALSFSRHAWAPPTPRPGHGRPILAVTGGSGPGDEPGLQQLRRRYPRWTIWRGGVTGAYWAMPPPGHPRYELISAHGLDVLADLLAAADQESGW